MKIQKTHGSQELRLEMMLEWIATYLSTYPSTGVSIKFSFRLLDGQVMCYEHVGALFPNPLPLY